MQLVSDFHTLAPHCTWRGVAGEGPPIVVDVVQTVEP